MDRRSFIRRTTAALAALSLPGFAAGTAKAVEAPNQGKPIEKAWPPVVLDEWWFHNGSDSVVVLSITDGKRSVMQWMVGPNSTVRERYPEGREPVLHEGAAIQVIDPKFSYVHPRSEMFLMRETAFATQQTSALTDGSKAGASVRPVRGRA